LCVFTVWLEPILSEILENPTGRRATRGTNDSVRSGGQKERGLGGMNFCPPSLSAAAEFRASETGVPHSSEV